METVIRFEPELGSRSGHPVGGVENLTVIGGEAIDDVHIVPERLLIFEGGQPGAHFAFTSEGGQIVDTEEQMMRADFASHLQSLFRSTRRSIKKMKNKVGKRKTNVGRKWYSP